MWRRRGAGVAAAMVSGVALVAAAVAWAGPSSPQVQMLDNCDGPSFNAAVGAGTCIRNGGLSFEQFLGALAKGGAPSWRFSPGQLTVDAGSTITAHNRGGEFHTFTPVVAFGGGCVPELNGPLGLTPVPECATPGIFGTTGAGPGGSVTIGALAAGTERFMCLIHPWMRATVSIGYRSEVCCGAPEGAPQRGGFARRSGALQAPAPAPATAADLLQRAWLEAHEHLVQRSHTLLEAGQAAPAPDHLEILPGPEADEAGRIIHVPKQHRRLREPLTSAPLGEIGPSADELVLLAGLHDPRRRGVRLGHTASVDTRRRPGALARPAERRCGSRDSRRGTSPLRPSRPGRKSSALSSAC